MRAAEAQGGKATAVAFDAGDSSEPSAYDVTVLKADGTTVHVMVDATNATIIEEPASTSASAGDGETADGPATGEAGEAGEDADAGGEAGEQG